MPAHPLTPLMRPRSIAVLGASPRPGSLGNTTVLNLLAFGFDGPVYPIHPTATEVAGLPCYPSLAALPAVPDCAAVALAADKVVPALTEAAERGVLAAVIFASGFSETGPQGRELQAQLRQLCQRTGLKVCGPNCLGIANITDAISLYSASIPDYTEKGGLAVLSQSGSGSIVINNLARFGFSYLASTGNEAGADMAEYLDYLAEDPATRVIACFMETVRDPQRFAAAARKALRAGKPVVALKVGRSQKGSQAAAAHTGSLAGSAEVYADFFRRNGVIATDDLDEFVESIALMLSTPVLPRGDGLAVVNVSGGEIALTCDLAERAGVRLPDLAPETVDRLRKALPAFATVSNPLDATGVAVFDMAMYRTCIAALAADPNVALVAVSQDCPAALCEGQVKLYREIARATAEAAPTAGKPVLFYSNIAAGLHPEVVAPLAAAGVPALSGARGALLAIRRLFEYSDAVRRLAAEPDEPAQRPATDPATGPAADPGTDPGTNPGTDPGTNPGTNPGTDPAADPAWRARLQTGEPLTEREAKEFLAACGLPVTREQLATTAQAAVAAAERIGYPVVLKIESPDLPHKSDAGGVKLDLANPDAVAAAFTDIMDAVRTAAPQARIGGVVVQEMVRDGIEVIAGLSRQEGFGTAVVVGTGGVLVELVRDSALALAPLDRNRALDLIQSTRLGRLLAGYRGAAPGDMEALADVLLCLSSIALNYGDLIEGLDLNPIAVLPRGSGVRVLDALLIPRQASNAN